MLLLLLLLPKRQAHSTGEAHQVVHIELDRLAFSKFILLFRPRYAAASAEAA